MIYLIECSPTFVDAKECKVVRIQVPSDLDLDAMLTAIAALMPMTADPVPAPVAPVADPVPAPPADPQP